MNIPLFDKLRAEGLLSELSFERIKTKAANQPISVHWELKTLLYLGVLLLSGGLGILIYKNIDTIGHQFILLFIALVSAGCFYYCTKHKLPFSLAKVAAPNSFFDYVLLLGCLTFITFVGYLQYQYNVFGNRYGLATFISMLLLFFTAYYFDHLGILSLAITNLAAWLGITVTPLHILEANDFNSTYIIIAGVLLGIFLIAADIFSRHQNIKKHFAFTYANFGIHLLFISALAAVFSFYNIYLLCFLVLMGIAFYCYRKAMQEKSFYFLLITTIYSYIAVSYVIVRFIAFIGAYTMLPIYFGFIYFIASAVGMILFLVSSNKKMKINDSL